MESKFLMNNTFPIVLYGCDGCACLSSLRSRITHHQQRVPKCASAHISQYETEVTIPKAKKAVEYNPITGQKRSVDYETYEDKVRKVMCTHVPSGFYDDESDHGLEARWKYLVAEEQTTLRKAMFRGSAIDASVNLLRHLWGSKAPVQFRSYVTNTATRSIFVLKDVVEPGDPSACIFEEHTDREECLELVKGIYYALLEIADAVINECQDTTAAAFRDKLCGTGKLRTIDVLERNQTYADYRINERQRVTFANKFRPAILTEIRDTVMKRVCDTA